MDSIFRWCLFIIIICCGIIPVKAQSDFPTLYRSLNTAKDTSDPQARKNLRIKFLEEASKAEDVMRMIIGNLYLHLDYYYEDDFATSFEKLNEAERLTNELKDTLILGRIDHYKGIIHFTLQQYQEAINSFQSGLEESRIAKDSFFIAISMEQLGRSHAVAKNFALANEIYKEAIPLVKQVCDSFSLSTTLNNYGTTLYEQGKLSEAITVYKEGIKISEKLEDLYNIIPLKHNLAQSYADGDNLEEAKRLYLECKRINEENDWNDFLTYSYEGLSFVYDKLSVYDSAYQYLQKFHSLKDSIKGVETISEVNELRRKTDQYLAENTLLLEKGKTAKQKNIKIDILITSLALLTFLILGILYYYLENKKAKARIQENRVALRELTKILEVKNAEIRDLKLEETDDFDIDDENIDLGEIDFYDIKILTDNDWLSFKTLFSKAYPNYLHKIRANFPLITEAEERLFIFIKLQLTSKESANILGVQTETIKKTRSRLRKKLGLPEDKDLNSFIKEFQQEGQRVA